MRWVKRHLSFWARTVWGSALFLIITLAVVVQLGRTVFPMLDDYRSEVEQQLSSRLGVQVGIDHIRAEWTGLRPRVTFTGVSVRNAEGQLVFSADSANAEVSLLATMRDWRLGFRRIRFRGLDATLEQNESGRWWVQGLARRLDEEKAEDDKDRITDPMDIFLFGRRVELAQTHLKLLFRSGLTTDISVPHIRLENDATFHRLETAFAVDEGEQAFHLVIEGDGNPRDEANFDLKGYLQLQDFPSEKVLAVMGIDSHMLAQDADVQGEWHGDGSVNLALWFNGSANRGVTLAGSLEVFGSPLKSPAGIEWPQLLRSDLNGRWDSKKGWQLGFNQARLIWTEFSAPPVDVLLQGGIGQETRLAVASLDVAVWTEIVLRAGLIRGYAAEVLDTLRPRGELFNIQLARRTREQGYFSLKANIREGGVDAWVGAPALQGVEGYVEAGAWGGEIRLQTDHGFSMNFPQIYDEPLVFDRAQGAIGWDIDLNARRVGVSSSLLYLANEHVSANGHFNLRFPLNRDIADPEMTLVIGAKQGSAMLHHQLIPNVLPQPLLEWLDRAIQGGQLENAGFIYHGPLGESDLARVVQLQAEVHEGELVYDSQWPALRNASGKVYLDDRDLYVTDLHGFLGNVQVKDAQVQLLQVSDEDLGVRVRGSVAGDSRAAAEFLAQSPLRDLGGDELASWQWQGELAGNVDLLVPFDVDHPAAYQKVKLRFIDNRLVMPNLNLDFANLNGPLEYDSATGLSSSGIGALLWGKPVSAAIRTEMSGNSSQLLVDLTGSADVADVRKWSARPELVFAAGVAEVTGQLKVPLRNAGDTLNLSLTTPLEGVDIMAPPPLGKTAAQAMPLQIEVEHQRESGFQHYRFVLQDLAKLLVINQNGVVRALDMALGHVANSAESGIFHIHGQVDSADAMVWWDAIQELVRVRSEAEKAADESGEVTADQEMPIRLDLVFGNLQAGDLELENFHMTGGNAGDIWKIGVEHPTIAGSVTWISDEQPLQLQLERLYLPDDDVASGNTPETATVDQLLSQDDLFQPLEPEPDFWQSLDLAAVPPMDIQIQDLRSGDRQLGRWDMKLRPIEKGLLAYDLTAATVGLNIAGRGKPGAELIWLRTDSGNETFFSGQITGSNLGDTFRHLGLDPALTSSNAVFDVDLQWSDVPPRFTLANLAGEVDLTIERGIFSRGGAVGENPLLKLIGLLNFDTLARRLRLDFSDLSSTGLGYETIRGSLLFRTGSIHIRDPLQVETPSSNLQLVGDLNVVQETMDTQLVATLPLAGNLTMAAVFTGGVPLAIGVYVMGKVFKDQVDRVSSLRYDVTGRWDDPKVKLERIFENTVQKNGSKAEGAKSEP